MRNLQVIMRKTSKISFICIACFLIAISCKTEVNSTEEKEARLSPMELIAAAHELDSLFLVAFNKGDLDAIMALYWNDPGTSAYPPAAMQLRGFDAVKHSYRKYFEGNPGAKLEYVSTNNVPFSDVVLGHGIFRYTMTGPDGNPISFDGRYTEIKALKNGKMVILHDHTSLPMPTEEGDSSQQKKTEPIQ
ncbi:MAG: nuclear transport factor 2 family protein [Saprospiraceae bacterium]|nr:nuclear transport factor 2 family protein [Saprospiraceae bacterium]